MKCFYNDIKNNRVSKVVDSSRSFTYVGDVASVIIQLLTSGKDFRIINVGSHEKVSMSKLYKLMCSIYDFEPKKQRVPRPKLDVKSTKNSSLLAEDLGIEYTKLELILSTIKF